MNRSDINQKVSNGVERYGSDVLLGIVGEMRSRISGNFRISKNDIDFISKSLYQTIIKVRKEFKLGWKGYSFHKAIIAGYGDIIIIYKHKTNDNIRIFRSDMLLGKNVKEIENIISLDIEGSRVDFLLDDFGKKRITIVNGDKKETDETHLQFQVVRKDPETAKFRQIRSKFVVLN